jgi:hypothetical protein
MYSLRSIHSKNVENGKAQPGTLDKGQSQIRGR